VYLPGNQDLQFCDSCCIIAGKWKSVAAGGNLNPISADGHRWFLGLMMKYILLGLCAYPALAMFEYASLKKIGGLRQTMALLAFALPGFSLLVMCVNSTRFALPAYLSWLGWVLAGIFGFMLIYSLFLEIPFAKTYMRSGCGDQLITTGTYALSRHPGVMWLALFLLGLLLATRSRLLLVAAPIWLAADALYVWVEEKLYLEKAFPDYEEYQRETPMLLPTPRGIRRCLKTMRHDPPKNPEV